ncbi:MAG TPA: hypothetical protein VF622_17465 [Segetibacter sp.]
MFKLHVTIFVASLFFITLQSFSRGTFFSERLSATSHFSQIGQYPVTNNSDSGWQFKAGDKIYSGTITKAFISPDNASLMFWGPSHNSADTIISVVANFRSKFVSDVEDASSTEIGFVYGKVRSVEPPSFYIDPTKLAFIVTVKNYNHKTKVAHGTISGIAKDSIGNNVEIKNGKFKVQL